MVNCIWFSSFDDGFFILKFNFRWVNLELPHTIFQGWIVIAFACDSNHSFVKIFCKLVYFLRSVSIGINWNEYRFDIEEFGIWCFFNFLQSFSKFHERVGANIRAITESEVYQIIFALEILIRNWFSISSHQIPISSYMCLTFSNNFLGSFSWWLFSVWSSHELNFHDCVCQDQTCSTDRNYIVSECGWNKWRIFILFRFLSIRSHLSILGKIFGLLHLSVFCRVLLRFTIFLRSISWRFVCIGWKVIRYVVPFVNRKIRIERWYLVLFSLLGNNLISRVYLTVSQAN